MENKSCVCIRTHREKKVQEPSYLEFNCEMISIWSNPQWDFEESVCSHHNKLCNPHLWLYQLSWSPKPSKHIQPLLSLLHPTHYKNNWWARIHHLVRDDDNFPVLFKLDVEGFEYDFWLKFWRKPWHLGLGTTDLLLSQISVELLYATIFFVVVVNTVGVFSCALFMVCLFFLSRRLFFSVFFFSAWKVWIYQAALRPNSLLYAT